MDEVTSSDNPAYCRRLTVAFAVVSMLLMINTHKIYAQTAVAGNSGPICAGSPVMLYETGGDAVSWEWSSSGTAVFNNRTLQNPTATGAVNGEIFTVRITDAGSNTASASTVVTVFNAVPSRPGLVTGNGAQCVNATGVVYSISPVANATSYLWEVPTGVEITSGQGTVSITVNIGPQAPASSNIRVSALNACGTSTPPRNLGLTVTQLPLPAGAITGSSTFTAGETGVPYSVGLITSATSYVWSYTGTGVTINGNGTNSVTLDFSSGATAGQLRVYGSNICGTGTASTLELTPAAKRLALTSVLLESLYSGTGTMRQAWNETGPQYAAGVADHITIELHDAGNYSSMIWALPDVPLSTSGTAEINIPAAYGGSYYITVMHRNSIATTTALPVSFAGSSISQSFGAQGNVYGGNLKASADNYYIIFGGDANQDGSVDTGDYTPVVNNAARYTRGYIYTDIDGNGSVDTGDYSIMVNNAARYVRSMHP
ncbi:hypothetical protein EG827_09685 [bacterium]|nr:hypothetical protein [bacterium]